MTSTDLLRATAGDAKETSLDSQSVTANLGCSTLLELVNDALACQPVKPRMQIGPYRLGGKIAEGSTSAIYCVVSPSQEPPRVLRKMKLHDPPERDVERFSRSLKIASDELCHPNILRPEVVAEHEGLPYAVMPHLDTLERLLACDVWAPARSARVMHQLASAVAHAHERGVIHCDLKPGNILWQEGTDGADGKPLIIDFDSARRIDIQDDRARSTGYGGGATRAYMAPELATGGKPTVRVDIYSLGVIFYEMLSSRLPYEGGLAEVLAGLTSPRPVTSPRQHQPKIHAHVEAVCLACLEKNPVDRYRNAVELVDDLACLLADQRPKRYRGRLQRAKEWTRRYPWRCALAGGSLLVTAAVVWQLLDPRPRSIVAENVREARRVAAAIEAAFEHHARAAREAANDERVLRLLEASEPNNLDPTLKNYIRDDATGKDFAGVFAMSTDGWIRAHYPGAPEYIFQRAFDWRDYFRGARAFKESTPRAPLAYVARVFRSETTERLEFGFSAPIPSAGPARGVLLARISAQDAIDAAQIRGVPKAAPIGFWEQGRIWSDLVLGNTNGLARTAVLLGPRDRDRRSAEDESELPRGLVYVAHEKLDPRNDFWLDPTYAEPLLRAFGMGAPPGAQFAPWRGDPIIFDTYKDPFEAGDWSAAALPIRHTGYVALVQSKLDAPSNDPWRQFLGRLLVLFSAALLVGSMLFGLARSGDRPG